MKVIITGSTGMVGRAVLIECLEDTSVTEVLVINRNSIDLTHSKLKELLVKDFGQIERYASELRGYDACFHCMGVSAVGLSEEAYHKITYGFSQSLMDILFQLNPQMTVTYVSGRGSDSTEQGNVMWARVKGATENYMLNRGFKDAYAFRPGIILPEKGVKSKTAWYNAAYVVLRPFFPLMRKMKSSTGSSDLGRAMLAVCRQPDAVKIVEAEDINRLSRRNN